MQRRDFLSLAAALGVLAESSDLAAQPPAQAEAAPAAPSTSFPVGDTWYDATAPGTGPRRDTGERNYFALVNQIGPTGVPLGGMGAGCVQFCPDGHFTRTSGINNWSTESVTEFRKQNEALENLHFLAIWNRLDQDKTIARRLQRDQLKTCGMHGYEHSVYRGIFPTAQVYFPDRPRHWFDPEAPAPCAASVRAWSGLIPQELKDSTVPAFWIEVDVSNNVGAQETAVALSWADLIGRGLLEPKDSTTIPVDPIKVDQSFFKEVPRPVTAGKRVSLNGWEGVRQSVTRPLPPPPKLTFQTAVTQVMILAEALPDAEITILPACTAEGGTAPWEHFMKEGSFLANGEAQLSGPGLPPAASAVCIKAKVPDGGKRTFRFLVAWYAPPVTPDPERAHDPRYCYGTGDYGAWYQNNFTKVEEVAACAIAGRQRIWDAVQAWHDPILDSSLPDWLKFKLINTAYTIYTNAYLNRAGDFSMMEGGMGGLSATMDVRNIVHPLYQWFFPEIDRHELRMFAVSQEPEVYPDGTKNEPRRVGAISHFLGNYYVGLATTKTPGPCISDVTLCGTCGYVMQLVNNYEQTGDASWITEAAGNIRGVIRYLKANIVDERGIPDGRATYDDYHHPDNFAYNASMYLMALEAAIRAGHVLNDQSLVSECEQLHAAGRRGYFSLWNKRYFAYGANRGRKELDERFHQGQVAGQGLTRFCGWQDIVPTEMMNAVFTTHCKLVLSQVPDYYADKLWDLSMGRGVDAPGSRCWPFVLEAFTAMPMIQSGWIEDAFEILHSLQLVHLRNGWMWAQNLWYPSELTRVDAPVSWMLLNNLAGAALDVPQQRLILGPGLLPGEESLTLPLFFPCFWAKLDYAPKAGQASLTVTRVLGNSKLTFTKLTGRPMGRSSAESKTVSIAPFSITPGATLDLAPYLELIGPPTLHSGILRRAGQVPLVEAKAPRA